MSGYQENLGVVLVVLELEQVANEEARAPISPFFELKYAIELQAMKKSRAERKLTETFDMSLHRTLELMEDFSGEPVCMFDTASFK